MAQHEAANKIGVIAATIIGINAMIGAGIFAMPAKLSATVGIASVFSYIIAAVLVLSIVFALGRLAVLHPGDAWGYRYPALWGGHVVGLISSCAYVFGVIVAMGFLTQQLGIWVGACIGYDSSLVGQVLLALIIALVMAGAEVSSWGQYVIAACVLVPMLVASIVCWMHAQPSLCTPLAPYGYGAVISSLPTIMFSLLGFESIASLYRVVAQPQRNVPRAALYSVLIVVAMFSLFITGALAAIDSRLFVGGLSQPFSQVITTALPGYWWLGGLIWVGAFFAIFGTLHSMVWSVAELFFDVLGKVRSSCMARIIASPAVSQRSVVLAVGMLTGVCAITLQADLIMKVTALFIVTTYFLSVVALLFDRRTWQEWSAAGIAVSATVSAGWLCVLSLQSILTAS
jgi:APA family basic amino acid/polyamine antiporter